jgi:hypothetical protein
MQAPAGAAAGTLEDPPAVRGGLALHSTLGRQVRRAAPMPALPGHGAPRSARCVPRRAPAPQSRAARASARQSESASRSRSERHAGSPEAAPGAGACSGHSRGGPACLLPLPPFFHSGSSHAHRSAALGSGSRPALRTLQPAERSSRAAAPGTRAERGLHGDPAALVPGARRALLVLGRSRGPAPQRGRLRAGRLSRGTARLPPSGWPARLRVFSSDFTQKSQVSQD